MHRASSEVLSKASTGSLRCLRRILAEARQQLGDRRCRLRRAEQKALNLVVALGTKLIELLAGLDTFRSGGDAEALREPRNRPDNRNTVGAVRQIADEGAIDLDLVERETPQIAQARIAGTEIVH